MGASQGASPNPSLSTGASAGEPSLSRRASSGPGGHIVVEIRPDLSLWSTSVGRDDSGVLTATKDKDAPGDVRRIIRDTRRAAGLSQQRLATLANCSVATLCRRRRLLFPADRPSDDPTAATRHRAGRPGRQRLRVDPRLLAMDITEHYRTRGPR
jgi:hypothetical protein